MTCIDPHAKDQVANYKCTCIVCKSTDQSALDCDGGGGGVGSGQTGEEGEESGGEGVQGEENKVENFTILSTASLAELSPLKTTEKRAKIVSLSFFFWNK